MKSNFKALALAVATIVAIGTIALVSCDKDDLVSNPDISSAKESVSIPYFDSREEMQQAIDVAITFDTVSDLIDFEQKQGRRSIGAISDAFYEAINLELFSNEAEVLAFFESHKDVLDTIMENDEVSIMPKWSNTPCRYVANAEGMFAVEGMYYKLFKKGVVTTRAEYAGALSLITDDDLDNLDTSIFRYIPDEVSYVDSKDCITKWNQPNNPTSDNNRIHIVLVTNTQTLPGFGDVADTRVKVYNSHKWAGVWWTSRHNLSCTGSVRLHVKTRDCSGWEDYVDVTFEKHQKANVMWIPVYQQPCYWNCVSAWDILFNRYYKYYHYDGYSIDAWYPGHAVEHHSN